MVKLALIGYGKMGRMVHDLAKNLPVEIVSVIDPSQENCCSEISLENLNGAEVSIDFSHPSAVMDNISTLCRLKQNLVVGTTGWHKHLDEVKDLVLKTGNGFLYGANMSVGMNLFYEIISLASGLMNSYEEYDAYGLELHHKQKADSPSGTARVLADILINNMDNKTEPMFDMVNRKIHPEELHFASIRAGSIPGTHTIGFDSEADTIELTHRVRNRTGFAMGALKSAIWLKGKTGFFTITDYIRSMHD